jgi:hypothetical protein
MVSMWRRPRSQYYRNSIDNTMHNIISNLKLRINSRSRILGFVIIAGVLLFSVQLVWVKQLSAASSISEAFTTSLTVAGTSTTTPPSPTTTPLTTGTVSSSGNIRLQIYDINVKSGQNQAEISFLTTVPSQARIYWGTTPDHESGSLSSLFYGDSHDLVLTGLLPGTRYFARIEAVDAIGFSVFTDFVFTTNEVTAVGALVNPRDFKAEPELDYIHLSWVNPEDSRFDKVRIIRSENFFPRDPYDGVPLYEGSGQSFDDRDIVSGRTYYYTIFSKGVDGMFSSGSLAKAYVPIPGQEPIVTPVNPLDSIPPSGLTDPKITALALSDFEFIQEGKILAPIDGRTVAINGSEDLTIRLSYAKTPEILKSIAFTLTDPDDSSKVFPFLLRINSEKTYYEATIGALGRSGDYALDVAILDFQNEGLKKLTGNVRALAFVAGAVDFENGFDSLALALIFLFIVFMFMIFVLRQNMKNRLNYDRILAHARIRVDTHAYGRRKSRMHTEDNKKTKSKIWSIFTSPKREIDPMVLKKPGIKVKDIQGIIYKSSLVLILTFSIFSIAQATFNKEINYQGKLTTPTNIAVTDGAYNIRFKLYDAGQNVLWTETWCYSPDNGATCDGTGTDNRIDITNGLFSTLLGSTTALTGIDFDQTLYLGVQVGGFDATPDWDTEMTPRKMLGAVPAAFIADIANFASVASTSDFATVAGMASTSDDSLALQGLDASHFIRSDIQNSTSSATTFLNILQSGVGKIAEFFGTASQSVLAILSDGNIGIGTTSPSQRLSVEGNTHIAGNLTSSNITATGTLNVSGNTTLGNASTTNLTIGTAGYITGLSSAFLAVNGNGQIVATTSPLLAFNETDPYYSAASSSLLHYGTTSDALTEGITNKFWSDALFDTRLNATTSLYQLATLAGLSTIGSSTGQTSILGHTILNSASTSDLTVTNLASVGSISIGSLSGLLWGTNGAVSAVSTSTLGLLGTGVAQDTYIPYIGANQAVDLGSQTFTTTGQTSLGNASTTNLSVSGQTYLTGNVGIGTTSPYAKLSVVGQIVGEYFTATSTTATSTLPNLAITNLALGSDSLNDITGLGLTISSNALSINHAYNNIWSATQTFNGNIQIQDGDNIYAGDGDGTLRLNSFDEGGLGGAPLGTVHIGDATGFDASGATIYMASGGGTAGADAGTVHVGNGNGNANGNLIAYGNVGIGTTSPSQTLHVQGNQRLTGGLFDSFNATGTLGSFLTSTGTSTRWLPMASLGLSTSGSIIVIHKDGTQTSYSTTTDTDSARGQLLLSAMAAASSSDSFYLSANTYDIGTEDVDLSLGGTGDGVSIHGQGEYMTRIKSAPPVGVGSMGIAIQPGNGSEATDLTIEITDNSYQAAGWGSIASNDVANAILKNVRILTFTDGIYFANAGSTTATVRNAHVSSNVEDVYWHTLGGTLDIYDSNFIATADAGVFGGGDITRGVMVDNGEGVVNVHNTNVTVSGGSSQNYGVYVTASNPSQLLSYANVYGGTITTSGLGADNKDLYNEYEQYLAVTADTIYNVSKTSNGVDSAITTLDSNQIATSLSNATVNVGIGTTTPSSLLTVNGTTTITGSNSLVFGNPANSHLIYSPDDGNLIIDSSSYLTLDADLVTVNGAFSTDYVQSDLIPDEDNAFRLGTTTGRWKSLNVGTGDSTFAGNLGIGTTSPSNKLEVAGNSYVSGNLTAANITATGTLSVSGTTTASILRNGEIYVVHRDGSVKYYQATSSDMWSRGSALNQANASSTEGDAIYLAGGDYFLSAPISLYSGMSLIGSGATTTLYFAESSSIGIRLLGDDVMVADLTMYGPQGIGYDTEYAPSYLPVGFDGIKNFLIKDVNVFTPRDSLLFYSTPYVLTGKVLNSKFTAQAYGVNSVGDIFVDLHPLASSSIEFNNVDITSAGNDATLLLEGPGGTLTIKNSVIDSNGELELVASSGAVIVTNNSNYDALLTDGDVSDTTAFKSLLVNNAAITNASTTNLSVSGLSYFTGTGLFAGNLGIGTTSPSQRLSVEGNTHIAGNLTSSNITATGTLNVSGNTTLTNASTTNITIGTAGYITGLSSAFLAVDGNGQIIATTSPLLAFNETDPYYSAASSSLLRYGTTSDALTEGITNKFWSDTLFDTRLNATTSLYQLATLAGLSTIGSSTGQTTILGNTFLTNASTTNLSVSGQTYLTGNVGIGTTSPVAKLSITGTGTGTTSSAIQVADSSNRTRFIVTDAGRTLISSSNVKAVIPSYTLDIQSSIPSTLNYNGIRLLNDTYSVSGANAIDFVNNNASYNATTARFSSQLNASGQNPSFDFWSANSSKALVQRFGVITNGNFYIGTTSTAANNYITPATAKLYVWGTGVGTGHLAEFVNNASTSVFLVQDNGNVGIGVSAPTYLLQVNGEPAANGYTLFTNYSDARLKENISYLDNGYLDKVMKLKPSSFNYNDLTGYDEDSLDRRVTGFIAQDMLDVFPEMVGTTTIDGTSYYDTNLSALPIYLTKAIQEQQAEIDTLASTTAKVVIDSTKQSQTIAVKTSGLDEQITALNSKLDLLSSTTERMIVENQDLVSQASTSLGTVSISTSGLSNQISILNSRIDDISTRVDMLASSTAPEISIEAVLASSTIAIASTTADQLVNSQSFIEAVALSSASSTTSTIVSNPSFLRSIAMAVTDFIKTAGELAVNKLTAHIAYFGRVEAETVAVSQGLEMKDQMTGQIYCVSINSGDWDKRLGTCSATSTDPVLTVWTDDAISSKTQTSIITVPQDNAMTSHATSTSIPVTATSTSVSVATSTVGSTSISPIVETSVPVTISSTTEEVTTPTISSGDTTAEPVEPELPVINGDTNTNTENTTTSVAPSPAPSAPVELSNITTEVSTTPIQEPTTPQSAPAPTPVAEVSITE